jgi:hypothetical protein
MKELTTSVMNMKGRLLAFMLGLGLMLLSQTTFAQDPQRQGQDTLREVKVTARMVTTVEEIGPMRVRLNVLNPTQKPVRISILNYQNQPVFEDSFREREYNKVLNFNSTIPGRYSLHVASRKEEDVRRFKVEEEAKRELTASELERSKTSDVMATIYKSSPTKVMLQMVNNTGNPVEYIFRDTDQQVIHRGFAKDRQFAKSFDMSGVSDGKYTVEVKYQADKAAARSFNLNTKYERSFTWVDKRGKPIKPEQPGKPEKQPAKPAQ